MKRSEFGKTWYNRITDKVNFPIVEVLNTIHEMKDLPDFTHEEVSFKFSHWLIDTRDEFFLHERNKIRVKAERVIFNFLIYKYEHDPYYHQRIDWFLLRLLKIDPDWLYQAKWLKNDQWWVE